MNVRLQVARVQSPYLSPSSFPRLASLFFVLYILYLMAHSEIWLVCCLRHSLFARSVLSLLCRQHCLFAQGICQNLHRQNSQILFLQILQSCVGVFSLYPVHHVVAVFADKLLGPITSCIVPFNSVVEQVVRHCNNTYVNKRIREVC